MYSGSSHVFAMYSCTHTPISYWETIRALLLGCIFGWIGWIQTFLQKLEKNGLNQGTLFSLIQRVFQRRTQPEAMIGNNIFPRLLKIGFEPEGP